jgi:hypothetical protein
MAGCWGQWALADDGIYFVKIKQSSSGVDFFSFSNARITTVVGLDNVNDYVSGFAISPTTTRFCTPNETQLTAILCWWKTSVDWISTRKLTSSPT